MNVKTFAVACLLSLCALSSQAKEMADVDPAQLVAKYGKPDRVQSSENEKPKPLFITRLLEYRKAGVRIALLANNKQPPYTHWKLMGFQNLKTKKVISQEEFERRIKEKR